jgi:hypothetical protein
MQRPNPPHHQVHRHDTTTPVTPEDTRQGSLNVQRPPSHPHPINDTTQPLLYSPDHYYNTLCICCLSCSCPCPAPRIYPLPARTSGRLGGSPVGGHGDIFSGGSPWTVTGPGHCSICLICSFFSRSFVRSMLKLHKFCSPTASPREHGDDWHA